MTARKVSPNQKSPCGKQLEYYVHFFEADPGLWFVRGGSHQKVMPNAALRSLVGLNKRILRWDEWFGSVNTRELEDAISRAMKTGQDYSEFITDSGLNLSDGTQLQVRVAGMLIPCPIACKHSCRLIVGHFKSASARARAA